VVEERHAGREFGATGAIQVQVDANLRLVGVPLETRRTVGEFGRYVGI
jgi:hypothetical protein